ncbi:hypothetical protein GGTG_10397 [Gaeumannomyces tritici R3-111a-1]|uniref:Glycosyltransferase family 31 protein n=1 Tax=Gaeumannomyces tritici (strain R3-111a-1) TaxID=644352 RepID=J3PA71_GAET3|nr:hypothetical protein GGTG_10397 [Gaeumannomyces tritici R3-111a-1]EJT71137.1 hypothetical protein GGTG_10397 [Gaeumannomyces tritici R3-111a-1]
MLASFRFQRLLPLAALFVFGALLFLNAPRFRASPFPSPFQGVPGSLFPVLAAEQDDAGGCDPRVARLSSLGLSEEILYTRRCIEPVFDPHVDRDAVVEIQQPLIDGQVAVNLSSCSHNRLPPCVPLALRVPPPDPKLTYSHLIFGISTTYERLQESLPVFSHWLSASDALLVAVVVDADRQGEKPRDLQALERLYRGSDMRLRCVKTRNSSLTVDQNHFTVILDMLEAATPQTRWLGLLDDDTFFPSLYNMDQALAAHRADEPAWLGALSEDLEAVRNWGIMAFGGAGVFLSVPLAWELAPHVGGCVDSARRGTGDAILRDCVHGWTHAKLTTVPGLHQHDLMGDVAGFYESGPRPLSVHHWKSWYREPVDRMAAVAAVCGDCFLQRWRFGPDALLANGYSVTHYADGLAGVDLSRTEVTWISPNGDDNFAWSLGPFRDRVPDGRKKTYKVLDAEGGPGGLRQVYVYRGNQELGERDEVLELVWTH